MMFRRKCKECGYKMTSKTGCRFCLVYDRLIMLERMYYEMGGFQIKGWIDDKYLEQARLLKNQIKNV